MCLDTRFLELYRPINTIILENVFVEECGFLR